MTDQPLTDDERTPCEIWTRVMGYHRPVSAFNPGKQSEVAERKYFREHGGVDRQLVGVRQANVLPMDSVESS
ncbi:hypothetical protein HC928_00610 [bacterium]|nr:hypothetical protein [bacterium]